MIPGQLRNLKKCAIFKRTFLRDSEKCAERYAEKMSVLACQYY